MDVDFRQLVWRRLRDIAIIVHLHELVAVGGRTTCGRDQPRFERFAQVGEDFPDRIRLRDGGDEPDVAATCWALEMIGQYTEFLNAVTTVDTLGFCLAAVPEPSTWVMGLVGLACGGCFVRWRRKRA